jgi:L-amino acid N-acyltransferase YncA
MQFRNATIGDLTQIIEIYNSTIPSRMVTADTEPVSVESRVEWFEKHTPDKRPLWIVEKENIMIGWVALHSFYGRAAYDKTAEISIYLHENFRGKGFGKQVLREASEKSRKLGIHTLLGYIFSHNTPSLKLFYDDGFSEWGFLKDIAELDGVPRSLVIVGKRIDQ